MATKFYLHRISTAAELMFTDIFKCIDSVYNLSEWINNNDKFIYFFDSFIYNIKHNDKTNNKDLQEAKRLLNNIDKRHLYTFVGEYYLSDSQDNSEFENFNVNTLIENKNKNDPELNPDDIRVKKDLIFLGPGDYDPLKNINFYDNEFNITKLKNEDVSKLLATRFKSRIIRVFLVNKDKNKIQAAQNALNNYKKKYKGYAHLYKSEQKINNEDENITNFNAGLDIIEERDELKYNNKSTKIKKEKKEINYSNYFRELKKSKKK